MELPAIDDLAFRRQIFAALLTRKRPGATAPELGADREFDRLLGAEKWAGDPLYLMMAGLAAGQLGVKGALSLSRADLATNVAQRELNRIGAIASGAGVDTANRCPGFLARHLAVLATLAQGLSLAEARQLIKAEKKRLGSSAEVNATLEALCDTLPLGSDGREIAPILPDVIGEAALLIWLGDAGVLKRLGIEGQSCIDRMAESALDRVSEVVVRAAQDFAAAGREEPVRWLAALSSSADLGALMQITYRLPPQTLALRELGAGLMQRIVDGLRPLISRHVQSGEEQTDARDAALSDLAISLNNLGNRLGDLGRREEALAAAQEAADSYRRLAAARPDAFLPHLAMSLSNLGNRLSDLGRREEALAAAQEAADVHRRLARRHDAFLPALAISLNNLGTSLSELTRREEPLAAVREAADIHRRLAAARPAAKRHSPPRRRGPTFAAGWRRRGLTPSCPL
jgi:tetratricopeptide (TPR) repeat protein